MKSVLYKYSRVLLALLVMILLSSCSTSVRFTSGASGSNTSGKYSSQSSSRTGSTNTTTIGSIPKTKEKIPVGEVQTGVASYYGDAFDGKMTASGTIYDQNQLTAAHRTLPFGSIVKVINQKNGKQVVVAITDRGPFKNDRIIDLSTAAAQEIDMIKDGLAEVELIVVK